MPVREWPLASHEVIVRTIAASTTRTRLTVSAEVDAGESSPRQQDLELLGGQPWASLVRQPVQHLAAGDGTVGHPRCGQLTLGGEHARDRAAALQHVGRQFAPGDVWVNAPQPGSVQAEYLSLNGNGSLSASVLGRSLSTAIVVSLARNMSCR
jgi:hypothetical protein